MYVFLFESGELRRWDIALFQGDAVGEAEVAAGWEESEILAVGKDCPGVAYDPFYLETVAAYADLEHRLQLEARHVVLLGGLWYPLAIEVLFVPDI